MRKILRTVCFTLLFFQLISSVPLLAKNPAEIRSPFKMLSQLPISPSLFGPAQKIILPVTSSLTITAPASLSIHTDPWLSVATNVLLGTPLVLTDNEASYSITNNAPAIYPIGVTNVIWTATDDRGNTATATQKVTVTDNEKPYIYRMSEISVVNDPGQCGAVVHLMIPDAYDNSGGPVTFTNDAPSYFAVGSVMITWTATDAYGNSDTSTQMITVIDNELPKISVTDIQIATSPGKCDATVNLGTPVTSDNCEVAGVTNDAPAVFPTGTTLVRWIVIDKAGYTATAIQKVTVTDTEKPVIAVPNDITVNNTPGQCGALLTLTAPVASDNCGVASITNNAPVLLPTGTTMVTWIATDNSGNQSTITQTIVVSDVQAPVFSNVPANITASCADIPVAAAPVVTDNCTASPVITFSQTSTKLADATKTGYYNYTITRTWIARDEANNTSTAKQVITVSDNTAPVITVPLNISVNNAANMCGAAVTFTVTGNDNCGGPVTLTYSKTSGSTFATGTTTVTVTAKDVSGNMSSKSFTITVIDAQKPSVKAPSNISVTVNNSNSMASNVNLGTPVTSDNCGIKSVTNNAPSSYPVGTTTVTWTARDVNNNVSTATQTVTVTSRKRANDAIQPESHSMAIEKLFTEDVLAVTVAPNPSTTYFTLRLLSKFDTPIELRVIDATGRVVDTKTKLNANSIVRVGQNYMPGLYFAEIIQGTQRKVIQLLKIK